MMPSTNKTKSLAILLSLSIILLPIAHLQAQILLTWGLPTHSTKYIGTPFLTKFQHGYIIMKSGEKSQPVLLRYNTYTNNVQYLRNKKTFIIPAKKLSGFVIKTNDGNMTFKNGFKIDQDHINQNTILRIIYNGDIWLLAHYSSTLMKNLPTYGTAIEKNKYIKHTHYFLRTANGTFHKVKLNMHDILGVLKGHNKKVKEFAKKHYLSFKKPMDLKKILAYYDHNL